MKRNLVRARPAGPSAREDLLHGRSDDRRVPAKVAKARRSLSADEAGVAFVEYLALVVFVALACLAVFVKFNELISDAVQIEGETVENYR